MLKEQRRGSSAAHRVNIHMCSGAQLLLVGGLGCLCHESMDLRIHSAKYEPLCDHG